MNLTQNFNESCSSTTPTVADKQVRVAFAAVPPFETVNGPFSQAAAEHFAAVAISRADVTKATIEEVA